MSSTGNGETSNEEAPAAPVRFEVVSVRPAPEPDVLAAIVSAIDVAWPRPVAPDPGDGVSGYRSTWRFSGRWWARPGTMRRDRPWSTR